MTWRIAGIMLVRNEELFVEQAFENAIGFCDEMILADNDSTDATWPKLERLAAAHAPKVRIERVRDPARSHDFVRPFAGTRTWVFGVDGDELYDPAGLRGLRPCLLAGEFADSWALFGNVLNVTELDRSRGVARGHLAPPCRSMTKLYNFSAIDSWDGPCPERLHGGTIRFRRGYDETMRRDLHAEMRWDASFFRCLHVCFLRRSSRDSERPGVSRANIIEKRAGRIPRAITALTRRLLGRKVAGYKEDKYRRGELVTRDVAAFFEAPARGA